MEVVNFHKMSLDTTTAHGVGTVASSSSVISAQMASVQHAFDVILDVRRYPSPLKRDGGAIAVMSGVLNQKSNSVISSCKPEKNQW